MSDGLYPSHTGREVPEVTPPLPQCAFCGRDLWADTRPHALATLEVANGDRVWCCIDCDPTGRYVDGRWVPK